MKHVSNLLKSAFILFFLFSFSAISVPVGSSTNTSSGPGSPSPVPEFPGGSLYLLLGGAGGALIWIRSFFKK